MKILAIRGKNIASLDGEFSVDFTCDPLFSAGLFAITGPTGAGKSTLLDVLCLALFDKTPRMNRARENGVLLPDVQDKTLSQNDCRSLLRRGTAEGYAEVDFLAVDGENYRARWLYVGLVIGSTALYSRRKYACITYRRAMRNKEERVNFCVASVICSVFPSSNLHGRCCWRKAILPHFSKPRKRKKPICSRS